MSDDLGDICDGANFTDDSAGGVACELNGVREEFAILLMLSMVLSMSPMKVLGNICSSEGRCLPRPQPLSSTHLRPCLGEEGASTSLLE